jgi:hypothetical protein
MTQATTSIIERSAASTPAVLRSSATTPGPVRVAAVVSSVVQAQASTPVVAISSVAMIRGPQGPPGDAENGAVRYQHTQTTPSQTWVVYHQLGARPVVEVIINGESQIGRVTYPNLDSCLIEFNSPVAGYAKCVG